MKVLITGATGFLGSHLADACLAAGDEVRALVRPPGARRDVGQARGAAYLDGLRAVEQVPGDLTDPASLAAAVRGVDAVYHAAALVTDRGSRRDFYRANVDGTRCLLEAARAAGVARFVYISSPSVVADGEDQLNLDERAPYPARPLNLYCETKAAAERLVLQGSAPGFATCAIRPRAVWGPRDWNGAIAKVLARLRARRLPDLSGGRAVLASMCHCRNAAAACLLAARAPAAGGKAYFITDGEDTDTWAFIGLLARTFGVPPPGRPIPPRLLAALIAAIELLWRLPPIRRRWSPPLSRYSVTLLARSATYDTGAAARDLGYRPVVGREQGLAELVRWVAEIGGLDEFLRQVDR